MLKYVHMYRQAYEYLHITGFPNFTAHSSLMSIFVESISRSLFLDIRKVFYVAKRKNFGITLTKSKT